MYKGVKLTELPCSAKSPKKYARKVLTHLFSQEELAAGLYSKVGPSSRQVLSPKRSEILMSKFFVSSNV